MFACYLCQDRRTKIHFSIDNCSLIFFDLKGDVWLSHRFISLLTGCLLQTTLSISLHLLITVLLARLFFCFPHSLLRSLTFPSKSHFDSFLAYLAMFNCYLQCRTSLIGTNLTRCCCCCCRSPALTFAISFLLSSPKSFRYQKSPI